MDSKAKEGWRAELVREGKENLLKFKSRVAGPLLEFQVMDLPVFKKVHKTRFESYLEDWTARAGELDALISKIQRCASTLSALPE